MKPSTRPFLTTIRAAVAALAVTLCTGQTASAGTFYECNLNPRIANGWVSPTVGFVFDDAGKATVVDGIILHFIGNPIPAKVTRRGDALRITWNIANAKDDRGQRIPTFRYVASLNTKALGVSVTAKPVGVPQRWSAKGTCKIRTK